MARQFLVPGAGFVAEDGTEEYLLPGSGLVAETSAGTAGAAPFLNSDWSIPSRLRRQGDAAGSRAGRLTLSPPPGGTPFAPIDRTGPQSSRRAADLATWLNASPALRQAAVGPVPFSQRDWPNPNRGARRGLDLRTWLGGNIALNPPTGGIPFAESEWPNPTTHSKVFPGWSPPDLLTTTLAPAAPAQAPVSPVEWQNPLRRSRGIDAAQAANLLLSMLAQPHGSALEWGAPRSRTWSPALRESPAQVAPWTRTSVIPVRPSEWPNPSRLRALGELTVRDQALLTEVVVAVTVPARRTARTSGARIAHAGGSRNVKA